MELDIGKHEAKKRQGFCQRTISNIETGIGEMIEGRSRNVLCSK